MTFFDRGRKVGLVCLRIIQAGALVSALMWVESLFAGTAWFALHPDEEFLPPHLQNMFVCFLVGFVVLMPSLFDWDKIRSWLPHQRQNC